MNSGVQGLGGNTPQATGAGNPFLKIAKALLALIMLTGVILASHGVYMKAKSALSQVLLARAFDERLKGDVNAKPWPWADFTIAARIEAPRIARSAIVIAGASGEAMAFGPGHMLDTPNPGEEGTAVIAAHRDTHFAWLKDLATGDAIRVTNPDGKVLEFQVTGMRIAKWNDSGINAHAYGKHMALITCWPFDSKFHGDLRYIVETELRKTDTAASLRGV
ncbi:MAG: sortase, marine proteobacterial type [Rhizobium sp.]|nr:sortase, marine proteobacterial type [Rhizobium sp.]